ncbi:hypothetical protein LCM4579_22780 [Ensifer sp. LCM 4579]|nr:hypothetical protein LCM4579_22780 [Ensifer sp. LCM 4579]
MVSMAGKLEDTEYEDEEFGWAMREALFPDSIIPAPHIIKFSEKLAPKSMRHLLKAFQLFWVDTGASANRLRICIEMLLDQLKVPRFNKPKKGKKRVRLALGVRLTKLTGKRAAQKHILDALRVIGNVGSHDGGTDRDLLLTAFGLLEDVLGELLDNKTANRDALARKIVAAKGQMSE